MFSICWVTSNDDREVLLSCGPEGEMVAKLTHHKQVLHALSCFRLAGESLGKPLVIKLSNWPHSSSLPPSTGG